MNTMRFVYFSLLLFPCILLAEEKVDFNTQIKSILSNKCIACHGPDEENREAGLRLDTFEGATKDLGDYFAIVPGDPEESEMIFRMGLDPDDKEIMPPEGRGDPLTEEELELFSKWIEQGAEYDKHWSYKQPKRTETPDGVHPVDYFVRERLEEEGLEPASPADKNTLIRRVFSTSLAYHPLRQKWMHLFRTLRRRLMRRWWMICSPVPLLENTGQECGSILPAMQTPQDMPMMCPVPSGHTGIM